MMLRGFRPSNLQLSSGQVSLYNLSKHLQLVESHLRCTFTTSSCQWAAKKPRLRQITAKLSAKPALPYRSPLTAYTEQLTNRTSPTLLYEAPSHALYKTGWLVLGGFCLTWAVINFNNHYHNPLEGTPTYVPYVVGVACVGMVAGAGWSFLKVSIFFMDE